MQILFFIVGVFLQWTLEVLGAGGAVWGMGEVWHLRGDTTDSPYQTNDDLRIPANIVFVMGFIRMFFRYSQETGLKSAVVSPDAWLKKPSVSSDAGTKVAEFFGFLFGFFLQWMLEVVGAGGATWGMSEVWMLRGARTEDPQKTQREFRWVANVTFVVGLFRMAQKYCPDHAVHVAMNAPHVWMASLRVVENKAENVQMQPVAGNQVTADDNGL